MNHRHWSVSFFGIGILLILIAVAHQFMASNTKRTLHVVVDLIIIGGGGLGSIYGGYWHWRSPLPSDRYLRLAGWLVTGTLVFGSVGTISVYIGSNQVIATEFVNAILVSGSIGINAGLLVGTVEGRAITRSREVARAQAKAESLQREQENFHHLNTVLRHYIFNSIMVIRGYTEHLSSTVPPDEQPKLQAIIDRIETINTLMEHFRELSMTLQEETPQETYDLDTLVESVLAEVDNPSGVDIETDLDAPPIEVDAPLDRGLLLFLTVTLDKISSDGTIRIEADELQGHVHLVISGTGIEELPLADDPEERTLGAAADVKVTLAQQFLSSSGTLDVQEIGPHFFECDLILRPASTDQ